MNDITLFERDWGNIVLAFCLGKMDVLPRITLTALNRAFIVNAGFLFFTLNLTLWDGDMQEFNRRNRELKEQDHDTE